MNHLPTKSLARLLVKRSLWADSCIRIANRACIGPMRMNTATATKGPKRTPTYASAAVQSQTNVTARTLRQFSMCR